MKDQSRGMRMSSRSAASVTSSAFRWLTTSILGDTVGNHCAFGHGAPLQSPLIGSGRRYIIGTLMRARILTVLTLLIALAQTAVAEELPSPTSPAAKAHLAEGNKAYRLKEFDIAIKEYRAGAALLEAGSGASFTFWWNLGQAYRMQARYEEAIWFYERFLEKSPLSFPMHREAAKGFIDEMRRELDKAATRTGPTEPAPSPLAAAKPDGAVNADNGGRVPMRIEDDAPAWHADKAGWALGGGGILLAGVGVGFLVSGSSLYGQAETEDRQDVRLDLEDRAASRVLIGSIVGGAGLALVATGVVKLAMTPDSRDNTHSVAFTIGPTGFGFQGSF